MDPADEGKGLLGGRDFAVTMTESNFSCPSHSQKPTIWDEVRLTIGKESWSFRTCTLI
jgi:hypothetical protein